MNVRPDPAPAHPPPAHPILNVLVLSLGGMVGLGLCRFAYALVLPDMRASLHWNYAEAGFMNTINAVGYLAGALASARFIRRFGQFGAVWWGTLACVVALFASAASGNFLLLSLARTLAGVGAALAFVGGGTLAATIAQAHPARSARLLGLFYTGPGTGIMISGLIVPGLLAASGAGSWWMAWLALGVIAAISLVTLLAARQDRGAPISAAVSGPVALKPMMPMLIAYLLFGAGYIAYLTFMIAWVRDAGGSTWEQSAFWCLIGVGAFASPWTWSHMLARTTSGRGTAALLAITFVGAILPLMAAGPLMLAISAIVFGNSFLAVVTSTTAFIRHNYPIAAWPGAIAAMTIAFSIGQTLGPVLTGAITDAAGSLSFALVTSAAFLAVGTLVAAAQPSLAVTGR